MRVRAWLHNQKRMINSVDALQLKGAIITKGDVGAVEPWIKIGGKTYNKFSDPYELMWSTELFDAEYTEIFEGDWLIITAYKKGNKVLDALVEVQFSKDLAAFCFLIKTNKKLTKYVYTIAHFLEVCHLNFQKTEMRVVGNIFKGKTDDLEK